MAIILKFGDYKKELLKGIGKTFIDKGYQIFTVPATNQAITTHHTPTLADDDIEMMYKAVNKRAKVGKEADLDTKFYHISNIRYLEERGASSCKNHTFVSHSLKQPFYREKCVPFSTPDFFANKFVCTVMTCVLT